ncbi:glycosyltransferase family 39 protein [Erythrobacter sp. A6_0]|uniref:ArnT family glycosyltransferase n=1 Tax=Erythrobacter sp. A6_0 TaxID=2821089 RepID=UPI001ADC2DAC|nr:glycosyltransferase family 39 protein [Erythrobacter sp. A6_0]MBO9510259.1 glycosyltransferase family 39 protein [Erythrobacter sp. A6_0]
MLNFSLPAANLRIERSGRLSLASGHAWRLGVCILIALGLRMATFGNPNLFVDEAFYFAAGIEMTQGALPFVDIWDRKPFGHFALYWAMAAISYDPIVYQIVAAIFAGFTASLIWEMARREFGSRAGCTAAILYLCALPMFGGYGGQSPVFYNALVATAAWIVQRHSDKSSEAGSAAYLVLAMGLGGLALTIKQTAVFEVAAFGLWASWKLFRESGSAQRTVKWMAVWIAIGAAPTLAIAGFYAASGHWSEFWQAMVLSNLSKSYEASNSLFGAAIMGILITPLIALAFFGMRKAPSSDMKAFILVWLAAAVLGLLAVPNFHLHYALPLLVPLSLASAPILARPVAGSIGLVLVLTISFAIHSPLDFDRTEHTSVSMDRLADAIRKHDDGRSMVIFDGPPMLYHLAGHHSPTPLAFPPHLSHGAERNVSHLDTEQEVRRLLAQRPGVIVDVADFKHRPPNAETVALINAYTKANCRLVERRIVQDRTVDFTVQIHGDCAA